MIKYGDNDVGTIFLGSHKIGKAYLGNNVVFQSGGRMPIVPSGYTELKYVQTDSDAYVDTGISGDNDDLVIKTVFMLTNYVQWGAVYGNYQGETYNTWRAVVYDEDNLYVNTNSQSTAGTIIPFTFNAKHTLTLSFGSCVFDGTSIATSDYKRGQNAYNICLGNRTAATNPGVVSRDIGLRIYSFSIKDNGVDVINYVPCSRDSDDAVGFFDLISETFKASDTATPFVAGPVR